MNLKFILSLILHTIILFLTYIKSYLLSIIRIKIYSIHQYPILLLISSIMRMVPYNYSFQLLVLVFYLLSFDSSIIIFASTPLISISSISLFLMYHTLLQFYFYLLNLLCYKITVIVYLTIMSSNRNLIRIYDITYLLQLLQQGVGVKSTSYD